MSKPKDLEIYMKIVLDREYMKNHSFEECSRAFAQDLAACSTHVARMAAKKIMKFKKTGRL